MVPRLLRRRQVGAGLLIFSSRSNFPCPRPADKPHSVVGDHLSGTGLAARLVRPTRDSNATSSRVVPAWPCSRWGLPGREGYPPRRWSLTPPFHYHRPPSRRMRDGYLFLWPCPGDCSPPGVTRHRALRSADFPRPRAETRNRDRLADLGHLRCYHEGPLRGRQNHRSQVELPAVKHSKQTEFR